MKKIIPIATLITVLVVILGPARAQTVAPKFRAERVYVHCGGPTKLEAVNSALTVSGNVGQTVSPGSLSFWDTNQPSDSVTDGAGCGQIDLPPASMTGATNLQWKGQFEGNLNTIEVHAWALSAGPSRWASAAFPLLVNLWVDGERLYNNKLVTVANVGAIDEPAYEIVFTLDLSDITDPIEDTNADGIIDSNDDLDGHTVHEIEIQLSENATNPFTMWVWDTDEVPSGLDFNPSDPDNPVVAP